MSRGAASAVFVDSSSDSVNIVKKNVEACGFTDVSKVYNKDYSAFASLCRDRFDIAFLDPPYKSGLLEPALNAVCGLMSDYGIIVCEHPSEVGLPETVGGFKVFKTYRYGKIYMTLYRKEVKQ